MKLEKEFLEQDGDVAAGDPATGDPADPAADGSVVEEENNEEDMDGNGTEEDFGVANEDLVSVTDTEVEPTAAQEDVVAEEAPEEDPTDDGDDDADIA